MKRRLKKWMGCLMVASMLATSVGKVQIEVPAQTYTAHAIEAGASFEGNPLKGFVPYNYGSMEFPHSMEWFYIAVNEVQYGMNEFDWTALERKLNDVASRGNQAVMRFYYDYPAEETGVPQFLIDQGLEMKYYNEPIDLGGDGYAPDYENPIFRQSMKNFIKAFGENYDGDGRLAYVTLGLLGFWGEWHNWPYDEDTSDGKADWSISTNVYREVLDAFDSAFDKTPLCVREPKSGISYSGYDIGFHDDSFGYATLSTSSGGQSWSFMQKMFNFGLQNKWQTNCIGGEVYPPSQYDIFSGKSPDGSFQDWDACMREAHATWMLNDAMRYYTGTNMQNARKAAMDLGYDFQVSTAYYSDVQTSDTLYLKVDIKNIGCAPFYYDHTIWPVEIGIKKGNSLVKSWRTDWDLCDIPANGVTSFAHTIENHGLSDGTYSIGIKVINPIANGKILGFANKNQGADGWLNLGTINVTSSEETTKDIIETPTAEKETSSEEQSTAASVKKGVVARETEDSVVFEISSEKNYETFQIFIDADGSNRTGYLDSGDTAAGFDYLIENTYVHYHPNNDSAWSWSGVANATVSIREMAGGKEVSISKDSLPLYGTGAKVKVKFLDGSWTAIDTTDIVSVEKLQEPTTEPTTEPETEPATEPATEPETEPATEPATEPETEPATEKVTEPATEPETEPETEKVTEPATEKETEPETTQPGIVVTKDIEVYGYQISTTLPGFRTIYSVDSTVEGKQVDEVGLIYGIEYDGYSADDMVINSDNKYVHAEKGTVENGRFSTPYSKAESYAMTMKFAAGTAQEFSNTYYVRAYAKLADGTYAYSKIVSYTIYDISDYLYQNQKMQNLAAHEYLYNNILSVVNPKYEEKEYGWSAVVKPAK